MDPRPIITRAEAKAAGLKRYFTGKPCPHGHVTERNTVNGTCTGCDKARQAKYRAQNPEKIKALITAYRAQNPEKIKASHAAWLAQNPKKVKAASTAYYVQNAEELKAKSRAWKKANPVINATRARNRHALKRAAEGSHTKEDIQRIYDAQNGKCAYCKTKVGKKYHVDHIQPLSKGGSNWPSNLQILCPFCNISKKDRDPITHMQSLGMLL